MRVHVTSWLLALALVLEVRRQSVGAVSSSSTTKLIRGSADERNRLRKITNDSDSARRKRRAQEEEVEEESGGIDVIVPQLPQQQQDDANNKNNDDAFNLNEDVFDSSENPQTDQQQSESEETDTTAPPPPMFVPLRLSIWKTDSIGSTRIHRGVLRTILEVLCTETPDLAVVDEDDESLPRKDVCHLFHSVGEDYQGYKIFNQTDSFVIDDGVSDHEMTLTPAEDTVVDTDGVAVSPLTVLSKDPQVSLQERGTADDPLRWTVWTVTYKVLAIGQSYQQQYEQNRDDTVEEGEQGQSDVFNVSNDGEDGTAAAEAVRNVMQLALDISMMDGTFDTLLRENVRRSDVDSSPVGREEDAFSAMATDPSPPIQGTFNGELKIAGLVVLGFVVASFLLLQFVSWRRRRRNQRSRWKKRGNNKDDKNAARTLTNNKSFNQEDPTDAAIGGDEYDDDIVDLEYNAAMEALTADLSSPVPLQRNVTKPSTDSGDTSSSDVDDEEEELHIVGYAIPGHPPKRNDRNLSTKKSSGVLLRDWNGNVQRMASFDSSEDGQSQTENCTNPFDDTDKDDEEAPNPTNPFDDDANERHSNNPFDDHVKAASSGDASNRHLKRVGTAHTKQTKDDDTKGTPKTGNQKRLSLPEGARAGIKNYLQSLNVKEDSQRKPRSMNDLVLSASRSAVFQYARRPRSGPVDVDVTAKVSESENAVEGTNADSSDDEEDIAEEQIVNMVMSDFESIVGKVREQREPDDEESAGRVAHNYQEYSAGSSAAYGGTDEGTPGTAVPSSEAEYEEKKSTEDLEEDDENYGEMSTDEDEDASSDTASEASEKEDDDDDCSDEDAPQDRPQPSNSENNDADHHDDEDGDSDGEDAYSLPTSVYTNRAVAVSSPISSRSTPSSSSSSSSSTPPSSAGSLLSGKGDLYELNNGSDDEDETELKSQWSFGSIKSTQSF